MSWQLAMNQKGDNFANYKDWRLPTKEELFSILDYNKEAPMIDSEVFLHCPMDSFWVCSPYRHNYFYNWYVSFKDGVIRHTYKDTMYSVRLVRNITKN